METPFHKAGKNNDFCLTFITFKLICKVLRSENHLLRKNKQTNAKQNERKKLTCFKGADISGGVQNGYRSRISMEAPPSSTEPFLDNKRKVVLPN